MSTLLKYAGSRISVLQLKAAPSRARLLTKPKSTRRNGAHGARGRMLTFMTIIMLFLALTLLLLRLLAKLGARTEPMAGRIASADSRRSETAAKPCENFIR